MGDLIISNTKDWPKEIQPHVDLISQLDGEADISLKDLSLAKSHYCDPKKTGEAQKISEIVCSVNSDPMPSKALKDFYNLRFGFSSQNPVHKLLKIESEIIPERARAQAPELIYMILGAILEKVKTHLKPEMSPYEKLQLAYQEIWNRKIEIRSECVPRAFFQDVILFSVDCDSSSFIVATVAYELGWPVYLVNLPGHVFIRWDDGQVKVNMDFGKKTEDKSYEERWGIKNLDERKLRFSEADVLFYMNRGTIRATLLGDRNKAMHDFTRAMELDPKVLSDAHYNRAINKWSIGKRGEAMKDVNSALGVAPTRAELWRLRGAFEANHGQFSDALKDFDRAIQLNPNLAVAYFNRGELKLGIKGQWESATDDLAMAIHLDPEKFKEEAHKLTLKVRRSSFGCGCSLGAAP